MIIKDANTPPNPGKETIYVDLDDEITSIIDKVENAKEKVVALVLPKRSTAMQSIVNMRLLKKSAEGLEKSVVLITSESALLPLAGIVGLHVAKNLQSKPDVPPAPNLPAGPGSTKPDVGDSINLKEDGLNDEPLPEKIDYNRSIGELASKSDEETPETIELEDEAKTKAEESKPKGKKSGIVSSARIKIPNFDKFRLALGLGIFGLIALVVFIYLAIAVLPKATINIQTVSLPVTATFTLNTSDKAPALDLAGKVIPASLKTSDQTSTQQVTATGQQNTGEKAKGTMTFYNCNVTDVTEGNPRTVPAGTGVTANGLTFITQSAVIVQPSHFAGGDCKKDVVSDSVNITAQTGGTKYNQDSTTYKVAGYSTISGTGSKTTGGTDNIQTILSQADIDGAKQKITSASSDAFSKTFQSQLATQKLYVIASTLKLSDPAASSTPAVGQPATVATVTVKITYSVLTLKNEDLIKAITDTVLAQVDKTKQKVEETDILKGATITVTSQSSPTAVTLNISEDTLAVPILDQNAIKKMVMGQKSGNIKTGVGAIAGVKSVNVKYSPFWVSKVPNKTSKITVAVTYVRGESNGR